MVDIPRITKPPNPATAADTGVTSHRYNYATEPSGHSNVIAVDPEQVWQHHRKLDGYLVTITSELNELGKAWKDLQFRWEGPDATTAQNFIDQLSAAFAALFGPDNVKNLSDLKPGQGSLLRLSVGVSGVAQNYGSAEDQVRQLMGTFADQLGASDGKGDGSHPSGPAVTTAGPVTETKTAL